MPEPKMPLAIPIAPSLVCEMRVMASLAPHIFIATRPRCLLQIPGNHPAIFHATTSQKITHKSLTYCETKSPFTLNLTCTLGIWPTLEPARNQLARVNPIRHWHLVHPSGLPVKYVSVSLAYLSKVTVMAIGTG